jgi:ABC-type lipoprotein release transport system permease subunit
VTGIYETGSGFDDGGAVVSLADGQRLLQKQRQVGAVQVKLKDPRQAEQVRAKLERLYPRLTVSQSSQLANQQQLVSVVQGVGLGIALLAIIIGGVGMTNTVMMGAFERTREIGTLRALGWSRRRVLIMVLGESTLLGAIGGLIGCAVGAGLVSLVRSMPALAYLQSQITLPLLGQGMLTAVVLGSVGGVYPAWWASRLMPVEALRYEGGATNSKFPILKVQFENWNLMIDIWKTLWRRRGRTALTVVGIGIALAAIVLLRGLMGGFVVVFSALAAAGDTDLMVLQANLNDMAYSAINERVGRQIAAMPGVKSVTGMTTDIVTTQEIPYLLIRGYDPQGPLASHFRVVSGRGLMCSHELLLGRPAAEALKLNVGDVARLGEAGFRVVGIFETGVGWEDACGLVSLQDAQTLFGKPHQVQFLAVKLNDPPQAAAIRDQIKRV